mmetsp:Transcript_30233/g.35684  ORF Transcript_30233/g.35684 Transcript_30233/m.35684 type:complete len:226 (+) Transcript_30233:339-1016(+)|eukprot:CAMPEP_0114353552 /NCGR_PEP_ID=MMETSP0101-20121206/18743_1 /TAXON_ID=38822 ORGANISM="Pteridomonas danica, Strain PT" /NCGR_SAMPLE_ID=MMETSP0101 /ASSEMBLY_ACC=CAM_ASM_000211 /LENGTH=225 /DNA_ID=CAMNT_0001494433 /DNA_START=294 /DNA_END=971 /DNA_ORIENTATION=+
MMESTSRHRPRVIFHLARANTWTSAKRHCRPYETQSFQADGFIQACDDQILLRNIAEKRHSRHQGGDFMILEIDIEHPLLKEQIVYVNQMDTELANKEVDEDIEHPRIMGSINPKVVISETFIPAIKNQTPHSLNPPPPSEPPPKPDSFFCCRPVISSSNRLSPSFLPSFLQKGPLSTYESAHDEWSGYDENIEFSFDQSKPSFLEDSTAGSESDDASYKSAVGI